MAFVLVTGPNFFQHTAVRRAKDRRWLPCYARHRSFAFSLLCMNDDEKNDLRQDKLGTFVLEVWNESLLFCPLCCLW